MVHQTKYFTIVLLIAGAFVLGIVIGGKSKTQDELLAMCLGNARNNFAVVMCRKSFDAEGVEAEARAAAQKKADIKTWLEKVSAYRKTQAYRTCSGAREPVFLVGGFDMGPPRAEEDKCLPQELRGYEPR